MTIRVGLDYDEPIFDWYDNAHLVCLAAGVGDPDAGPPTTWDPTDHYGITLEDWYEILNQEVLRGRAGMYGLPLLPQRVLQVRRLYTLGYGVHLITSRGQFGDHGEEIKRLTKYQIVRADMPYDTLDFIYEKAEMAKALHLDYFLDDSPRNIEAVGAVVPETYVLNKPWNADFEWDPRKRVDDLEEFVEMIINRHGDLHQLTTAQRLHVTNPLNSVRQ